jgi:hypothetical protein
MTISNLPKIEALKQKMPPLFFALQKSAMPNRCKANQLFRLIQAEVPGLPRSVIELKIANFYKIPFNRRTEVIFYQTFKVKPYPWLLNEFFLDLRKSTISETRVMKSAVYLQHLITTHIPAPTELIDPRLMHILVHRLVHPRWDESATCIELRDVITKWKQISFYKWGNRHDSYFEQLEKAMRGELTIEGAPESLPANQKAMPTVSLTQTEINWIREILSKLAKTKVLPKYPLSAGPKNGFTRTLEILVRDWNQEFTKSKVDFAKLESSKLRKVIVSLSVKLMKTSATAVPG